MALKDALRTVINKRMLKERWTLRTQEGRRLIERGQDGHGHGTKTLFSLWSFENKKRWT